MSNNIPLTPAEVLISSAVRSVGKREFLKTVEKMFGVNQAKTTKLRQKQAVAAEHQCGARVKGLRTGIKIGRFVLFEQARCPRREVDAATHLCPIHTNQVKKLGALPLGMHSEPLTEEQQRTFAQA
jgi:hypothetical protein